MSSLADAGSSETERTNPETNFRSDTLVLGSRELFRGERSGPRFGDDVWDLTSACDQPNINDLTVLRVDFAKCPKTYRQDLKRFCASRLLGPTPRQILKRSWLPKPLTVAKEFSQLCRLFDWLIGVGVATPAEIKQRHLDGFLAHLDEKGVGLTTQAQYAGAVAKVHAYRLQAGIVCLPFEPWAGSPPAKHGRASENSTPRIPEPVLGALLRWALFYVQVAFPDIERAVNEYETPAEFLVPDGSPEFRLRHVISVLRNEGRGLPAMPAKHFRDSLVGCDDLIVNRNALIRLSGATRLYSGKLKQIVDEAVIELGLEAGDINSRISDHPETGLPWRPRFSSGELKSEVINLQTACFILCAVSGMREQEIRRLKPQCCRTEGVFREGPQRVRIAGEVIKGRQTATPEEWIAIPQIAEAIAVAERMTRGEYLFSPWRLQTDPQRKLCPTVSNTYLNRFAYLVIPALAEFNGLPQVPRHKGQNWRLSGRQFRRSIAFYIAREPYGVLGGAIQYKHLSPGAFEGYVGTSRSGFRAEIESEQQLASVDAFSEIYEKYKEGEEPGGPGGEDLKEVLDVIRKEIGDFPGEVIDEEKKRKLLEDRGTNLHFGVINNCRYNESQALCNQSGSKGPQLNECQPAVCRNSVVLLRDLEGWKQANREAKKARKKKGISAEQASVIERDIETFEATIRSVRSR